MKIMRHLFTILTTVLSLLILTNGYSQPGTLALKKANTHPIQYYFSLPAGWSPKEKWPVVIVTEEAAKQFKQNAERFMNARKTMPFIIVAPLVTTNGQQGYRDSAVYPYSKSVWDTIDKLSICKFDIDGLQSIIKDVKENYSGSEKVFITGFEAGTHLVWAMVFQHPELLYAAAPVGGNFRNRCLENHSFSEDGSRIKLPIKNFTGSDDEGFGLNGRFSDQYRQAKNLAIEHGYQNISETQVPGKAHVPLPENVLEYFYGVWTTLKN